MDSRAVSVAVFLVVFLVPMTALFVWKFIVPVLRSPKEKRQVTQSPAAEEGAETQQR